MSVLRQLNALGQMRIDVPHLRSIESSVCADFDTLAGKIMLGLQPMVIRGFYIKITGAVGAPAENLELVIANGAIMNPQASESGTIFSVPDSRTSNEVLNSTTNTKVTGTFTASQTNYVGLDLFRSTDSTTSDLVQFLDADSLQEVPKTIPLARTLDYNIVISTSDFAANSTLLPLAIVTTDSGNNVTAVADARPMFFRLGTGGSVPNRGYNYPWVSRKELTSGNVFYGADKEILSLKEWMDATMTRIWEIGGGEYWYSQCAEKDLKIFRAGAPFANGEHFIWTLGTETLQWKGLGVLFGNSTGYVNEIADDTTDTVVVLDGQCLYVDLDRTQNLTGLSALVPDVANLTALSGGTVPGARYILAWRYGNYVYTRESQYAIGLWGIPATTTTNGAVRLNYDASDNGGSDLTPTVSIVNNNGRVISTGMERDAVAAAGALNIGTNAKTNEINIGNGTIHTTVTGTLYSSEIQNNSILIGTEAPWGIDLGLWSSLRTVNRGDRIYSKNNDAWSTETCAGAGVNNILKIRGFYPILPGILGDVLAIGNNGSICYNVLGTWQFKGPGDGVPNVTLEGLWVNNNVSADDAWIVGDNSGGAGVALHWYNDTFHTTATGTAENLHAVWGVDALGLSTDVWAAGSNETFIHWNGAAWAAPIVGGGAETMIAMWGAATNDIWAVGTTGKMYYWNGAIWAGSSHGSAHLRGIWGTSTSNIWAVGDSGTIIHWNGATWSDWVSPTTENLYDVWGSNDNDIWASGANGTLLKYVGGNWVSVLSPNPGVTLYSVWMSDTLDSPVVSRTYTKFPRGIEVSDGVTVNTGGITLNNDGNYKYYGNKTSYLFLNPGDFNTTIITAAGVQPDNASGLVFDDTVSPHPAYYSGQLRLPAGANITAIDVLAVDSGGVGTPRFTLELYAATGTATMSSVSSASQTITVGGAQAWYTLLSGTPVTGGAITSDTRSAIALSHVPDGGANPIYVIRAVRITYTYNSETPQL